MCRGKIGRLQVKVALSGATFLLFIIMVTNIGKFAGTELQNERRIYQLEPEP